MRKKFVSFALASVFMLSLSVSAHAETAAPSVSQEEARLAIVFQGVADIWDSDVSVAKTKTLHDFAGNEYTLAEYSPSGYAVYHNSSAVVLEKAENSPSPYSGLSENLYYAGPTHYYIYDEEQGTYTHTITGDTLGAEDVSVKAEVCSEAQAELNSMADTQLKTYVENSLNATQTAKVMKKYLEDDRGISMSYWAANMPSKANVVSQLKLDRPVIYCDRWNNPKPSGGTVDHVVVVYGYDNSNHLIAHFGWTDYTHVECTSGAFAMFVSSASSITSYS